MISDAPGATTVTFPDFNYSSPVGNGFISAVSGANTFRFNWLATTQINEPPGGGLQIVGTGTINLTGYDPTPGKFTFGSTSAGTIFTFQSNIVSTAVVPEPITLGLLGVGLVGLGMTARRRS